MKRLLMPSFICILINTLCVTISGQTLVESYPADGLILSRIEKLHELMSAEIITENIQRFEPLPLLGHTHEDSLNLQFEEMNLVLQTVRLNPDKVITVFPEAVNTDESRNSYVDYTSLIPILIEAINEQQKIIKEMNNKLEMIEEKNKQ